MNKKILVIGAGFLQSFIIKRAKELGYYVLAVDLDENAIGFKYCDEFAIIDICDMESCLEYAKEKNIDGVITGATDYGVITTSYIAEQLSLPGLKLSKVKMIKNKYEVTKKLCECNLSCIKQCIQIKNINDLKKLKKLSYPLIVKPVDGSGSRGVQKVSNFEELETACREAFINSQSGKVLIQDYIEGKEYGADIFIYGDKIKVFGPIGKEMTKAPYFAELGHFYPTCLNEKDIRKQIIQSIKALDINFGAVNIDYLVDESGKICIIDLGCRLGGNLISSHIVPIAFGYDYIGNLIKLCLNEKIKEEKKLKKRNVVTKILALSPGKVKTIDLDRIEKPKNVLIESHINIGDKIQEYHTNLDGCGYLVCYDDNIVNLNKTSEEILLKIDESIEREE